MWGIYFMFAVIYLAILFAVGVTTFRKGHKALFWIGILFPVLWIIGAVLPPTDAALARGV